MTERDIKRLLQRIKMRWRRTGTYTAVFEDGAEAPVKNPEALIHDGLIGVYNEDARLQHLREDLGNEAPKENNS